MNRLQKTLAGIFMAATSTSAEAQTYWTKYRADCVSITRAPPEVEKSTSRFTLVFEADHVANADHIEVESEGPLPLELDKLGEDCWLGNIRCTRRFRNSTFYYTSNHGRLELNLETGKYTGYLVGENQPERQITIGQCYPRALENIVR